MIAGIGIDAVSVERMADMLERFGTRFTVRVFTGAEIESCDSSPNRAERYAARFAAKEAVMKSLSTGFGSGARFLEIEVAGGGAPLAALSGGAKRRARELGVETVHVSLTHEAGMALAQAVAEKA